MKHSGKLVLWLAGGLFLHVQARAVTAESGSNPYANIVERNVFGLRPPPVVEPPKAPEAPVPNITLQGIISAFGRKQVLFKTMMSARPGEAAKETSLVMSEGERIDEVEVLEINEAAGTIKFRNHGKEQLKDLAKDGVKQPAGAAPGVPGLPGVLPPGTPAAAALPSAPGGSAVTTFGGNPNVTIPGRQMRLNSAGAGTIGTPATGTATPHAERPLTAEEQTVLMEVNRKLTEAKVKRGEMPPLPPTELTPPQ